MRALLTMHGPWLQDSPVGVGYSYAAHPSALAKTDSQAAADVTELLKALVKEIPTLQSSLLFLVGESYGGKLAALIGVSVARAIRAGTLNLELGGKVVVYNYMHLIIINAVLMISHQADNSVFVLRNLCCSSEWCRCCAR